MTAPDNDALKQDFAAPRPTLTVDCRQCTDCGHIGINDEDGATNTCSLCDWSGPWQEDDTCPSCGKTSCLEAACPRCGRRYRLIASEELPCVPDAATLAQPAPDDDAPVAYMCPAGCGCLWRDNRNGTMSLYNGNQKSCAACEPMPLAKLTPLVPAARLAALREDNARLQDRWDGCTRLYESQRDRANKAESAQAEPQEGDLLHTMMEWARTEEGRKQLADSYRPHLWACAKRVADPQNEAATCRHWCGDIEHCQPIASAPAQAEPQGEPVVLQIPAPPLPPDFADDGVQWFCPHCNPCLGNGNEKCRKPTHPPAQPPQAVDLVALMQEAQAIVEGKFLWKRFIDGTPLHNDIAVWMADFARDKLAALAAENARLTEECALWCETYYDTKHMLSEEVLPDRDRLRAALDDAEKWLNGQVYTTGNWSGAAGTGVEWRCDLCDAVWNGSTPQHASACYHARAARGSDDQR